MIYAILQFFQPRHDDEIMIMIMLIEVIVISDI